MRRAVIVTAAVAVAAGASLAATGAAAASAARAASGPRWRITQRLANLTVGGLWAGGARDAWLAGDACAHPVTCGATDVSNGTVVVRHWDGTAWRTVRPPKAYVNTPLDQGAGPVVATSASNAWVFAARGRESVDHADVLHWTGKRWAKPVRLADIEAAVAPTAQDVWAFGPPTLKHRTGYAAHYNGRTWTPRTVPIDGEAAGASSPTDIWVGGMTRNGGLGMEHWDGRSWRATRLAGIGAGFQPFSFIAGIAAIGPRNAWADATILGSSPAVSYLLHWNGRSWTRTRLPHGAIAETPVVPDGHGGIWLAADTQRGSWFYHYRGGRWTKAPVPRTSPRPSGQVTVDQLAWIPRTRSVWATGDLGDGTAILRYGP